MIGKPYLLLITNLFCNHKCFYCIQQKSSLDVRMKPEKIDVDQVLKFLEQNRIARSVKVMGGESTLHPDFEKLMDGLASLYKKIVLTTNVNGKWYKNFDVALEKMKKWQGSIKWNTTYHPAWMDVDLYIERIRKMKEAGLNVDQVATTDTPDLDPAISEKLHQAKIGWKLQTFTGRDDSGRLLPQTWADVNTKYPQLYDPSKYIDNYDFYTQECEDANHNQNFYRPQWVECTTAKFLIGPDNNVYPCHRHLYVSDKQYICGTIYDTNMENFKFKWNSLMGRWKLNCNTKCNPCDFGTVKIKVKNQKNRLYAPPEGQHQQI